MVHYRNLQESGINYIQDLYEDNGNAKPFRLWNENGLHRREFLKWYALIQTTCKLKGLAEQIEQPNEESVYTVNFNNRSVPIGKVVSKSVYILLMDKQNLSITSKPRIWNKLEDRNIKWEEVYVRPHKKSIDTKSRVFQYKFLNDLLVNNYWLCKWNLKDTDKCSFCQSHVETLEHIFWNCHYVQDFWEQIKLWLLRKTQSDITIDKNMVFLGNDDDFVYTMLLEAKKHIYYSRLNNTKPNFQNYLNWLEYVKKIEMHVSWQSNNSKLACRLVEKWSIIE